MQEYLEDDMNIALNKIYSNDYSCEFEELFKNQKTFNT